MNTTWQSIEGTIISGHGVASGIASDSPFPRGTLVMQAPLFKAQGLDLAPYHLATLNVSIHPHCFTVTHPHYQFNQVKWSPEHPAEDFSFSICAIQFAGYQYDALIYYPHPDTKIGHFKDNHTLEIIAPWIENIHPGDKLIINFNPQEIMVNDGL